MSEGKTFRKEGGGGCLRGLFAEICRGLLRHVLINVHETCRFGGISYKENTKKRY